MNPVLALLSEALGQSVGPEQIVFQRNVGHFAGCRAAPEGHWAWRSFNLMVLGSDGRPSFHVKCRPLGVSLAIAEAELLCRLGGIPECLGVLPQARMCQVQSMCLLITRHMVGAELMRTLARSPSRQRVGYIRASMDLARTLATRVVSHAILDIPSTSVSSEATRFIPLLADRIQLFRAMAAALSEAVSLCEGASTLPQHGDLTARNVFRKVDGSLVLLDFESYGRSWAPLLDSWSMARNLPRTGERLERGRAWWELPGGDVVREFARSNGVTEPVVRASLPVLAAECRLAHPVRRKRALRQTVPHRPPARARFAFALMGDS